MPKPLDQAIVDQIYALMREAIALGKQDRYADGVPLFEKAWALVPEPRYDWDISQISLLRLAKYFRDAKLYERAHAWVDQVAECKPNAGDAEPALVKGSIYLAAGDEDHAAEWLSKAYDIAGKRAFQGEDPKYLAFLKKRRKL